MTVTSSILTVSFISQFH